MVRASNFAEFVAQLSADDKELQKDLKSAETATKTSAGKMQSSLDGVSFSSKAGAKNLDTYAGSAVRAGQSSQVAARSVSALGAAAAATGSASLATGAQIGSMVAAADELAVGLSAATGAGVALLKVFLPIAITVGAITLAIKAAQDKFNSLADSIDATKEAASAAIGPLQRELDILRDRRDVSLGLLSQDEADARQADRLSTTQAELDLRVKIFGMKKTEALVAEKEAAAERQRAAHRRGRALSDRRQLEGLRNQKAEQDRILATERERAQLADRERTARRSEVAMRRANIAQRAGGLLVGAGVLDPSQLVADPTERRLASLASQLQGIQAEREQGKFTGSFGLRRISGPSGALKEGQTIGNQQITIQQDMKRLTQEELQVIKDIKLILSTATGKRVDSSYQATAPLQLTGAP